MIGGGHLIFYESDPESMKQGIALDGGGEGVEEGEERTDR